MQGKPVGARCSGSLGILSLQSRAPAHGAWQPPAAALLSEQIHKRRRMTRVGSGFSENQ